MAPKQQFVHCCQFGEEITKMTETLKKATTTRKQRATANGAVHATANGAVRATANGAEPKKATPRKGAPSNITEMKRVSHEQIANLAHRFWTERGRQHGHDAEDWLRAERELLVQAS